MALKSEAAPASASHSAHACEVCGAGGEGCRIWGVRFCYGCLPQWTQAVREAGLGDGGMELEAFTRAWLAHQRTAVAKAATP